MTPPVRGRYLPVILQITLAATLIGLLFLTMENRADIVVALRSITRNWHLGLTAVGCFLGCLMLGAWRWKRILAVHHLVLPYGRALRLTLTGQFFNAFLFGSLGGDAVKVFLAAGAFPSARTEAVASVFIDRLIGLLALAGLSTGVILARLHFFLRYPETRAIAIGLAAVLGGLLLLMALMVWKRRHEDSPGAWPSWLRFRTGGIADRAYRAFQTCLTHPALLWQTLAISLFAHLLLIMAAFALGIGLDIRTAAAGEPGITAWPVEFGNYLTVFPVINGISAIPATPGGLGTREAATCFLMGVPEFNVPASRAITLSLLLYVITLFWSLVGGVVYALRRPSAGGAAKGSNVL